MKNLMKLSMVALVLSGTQVSAMTCKDAHKDVNKRVEDIYNPLITNTERKIKNLKKHKLNPCNYYSAEVDQIMNYCENLNTYKSLKASAIDAGKDKVNENCFENNTEKTAQEVLAFANAAAVAYLNAALGTKLPEKAFFVDIVDIRRNGLAGGPNSIVNQFSTSLPQYKAQLDEVDKQLKKGITIKPGTNKHGLPNIKIGGGFKW